MRRGTMFWGSVLVILGFIFLLDNLGFFGNINIWGIIWPLFLIALGAWIIWGHFFRSSAESEHASISLDGTMEAHVQINHGAGRINLSSHTDPGLLVEGDFGGGLDVQKRIEGEKLDVKMSVPSRFLPFSWYPGYSLDWNFTINKDTPITIELKTGASDNQIDLSELKVSQVKLGSGASSTRLTMPANAGFTRLDVESGAASVDISVPPGVAARIRNHSGLSSLNIDKTRFPIAGDVYQSADYDHAMNKADINFKWGWGR